MRRTVGSFLAAVIAAVGAVFGTIGTAHAATAHTPVVFVHGYSGNSSNWVAAEAVFEAAGYSADELYAFDYDSYGDNKTNAAALASYVAQVRQKTGSDKIDIVNHSMGGLVSLWYIKELGGQQYVKHLASLAGANHGTTTAVACAQYVTGQEMIPGSSFINALASGDETPGDTKYATWYSPCDGVINPYTSTMLNGATNNYVTCENHLAYLTDTVVLSAVRAFLAT